MVVHTAISCNQGHRDNVCKHWTLSSPSYITVRVTHHHHLLQTVWWGQSSWMAVLPSQGLICSGCRCLCDNSSFGMVLSFWGKNKGNPDLRTSHWRVPNWHFPTFLDSFFFSPKMTCCHKNQSLQDRSSVLLPNLSFQSKTNFCLFVYLVWRTIAHWLPSPCASWSHVRQQSKDVTPIHEPGFPEDSESGEQNVSPVWSLCNVMSPNLLLIWIDMKWNPLWRCTKDFVLVRRLKKKHDHENTTF